MHVLPILVRLSLALGLAWQQSVFASDPIYRMQVEAVVANRSPLAHWGWNRDSYTQWSSHSNRLIPVYTFGTRGAAAGVDLDAYTGLSSRYRSPQSLEELYGRVPPATLNPSADYLDQTDLYRLQRAAAAANKKYIFLVVFDGMDWDTTRAASIASLGRVAYDSGRGIGNHFQDYEAQGTTQFGWMVTSPHNDGGEVNVDTQRAKPTAAANGGGYDASVAGLRPWDAPADPAYLTSRPESGAVVHAYTDSASSAVSMTAGIKTYNAAINVDVTGKQVSTIAHQLQQAGWAIGVVTSVPISHATPAAVYSHNVHRDDYQDLSRDLLGRPSVSHPETPLPGVDVLIGAGWGVSTNNDDVKGQGTNLVVGNRYLTADDLAAIDIARGGVYRVVQRQAGVAGDEALMEAAHRAAARRERLFGFFGVSTAHLPFRTANGDYHPSPGRKGTAETYTPADIAENPSLAEMTSAALHVLQARQQPFWLMVEAGDVDWANHDNNLDNSIGAVHSGDAAVRTITRWVERHSNWNDSLVIVTADHGHLLFLDHPQALADLIPKP